MHKARPRIEPKAEEADSLRRRLELDRIVVRHGDIERRPIHVLRLRGTFHRTVVLWTAIGRAQDQRLAKPVAQGLQLVQRRRVDQHLVSASAGDLGGREVRPAPDTFRYLTVMTIGANGISHDGLLNCG